MHFTSISFSFFSTSRNYCSAWQMSICWLENKFINEKETHTRNRFVRFYSLSSTMWWCALKLMYHTDCLLFIESKRKCFHFKRHFRFVVHHFIAVVLLVFIFWQRCQRKRVVPTKEFFLWKTKMLYFTHTPAQTTYFANTHQRYLINVCNIFFFFQFILFAKS